MSRHTPNLALDIHRTTLSSATCRIDQVWRLPWDEIKGLPILPEHTLANDVIVVPKEMVPATYWVDGQRTIDFAAAIPAGWARDEARTEAYLRRLKRIALLNLTQTVPGPKWRLKPPQPQTWMRTTKLMLRAARQAMETTNRRRSTTTSACPDGMPIFQNLSPQGFEQLREDHPTFFANSVQRLNGLFNGGVFDDWPARDVSSIEMKSTPLEPFSDAAFTEILGACFFLSSIQADLEACYREILSITQTDQGRRRHRELQLYKSRRIREWRGEILYPGFAFPYEFELAGIARVKAAFSSWPIENPSGVKNFLLLCQAANAQIINTATAGRVSELSTLGRNPLVHLNGEHVLSGLTFKESESPSGSERHWPLPHHAVEAVRRQQRLLETLGEAGPYLWHAGANTTTGVIQLPNAFSNFGRHVRIRSGVTLAEIDGDLSSHRYRKTMSRLAGLALEGASGILYDVLGHTDMDVTLGYMLSDPDFREDADRVRREVQHLRRKEIADELDECGGPAAKGLRIARDDLRARAIREDLGEDNPELLAALFPALQQVGPNRFCTADSKQKGLCSKVTGKRDVGACNASCIFRLERAAAAKDRKDAIESALQILSGEVNMGLRVFYQSQLIANLAAFEKTIDAFSEDARLREALKDCNPRAFEPLPETTRGKLAKLLEMA
ncbi:site-specific integrase [Bradyrhizobium sp. Arg62]|uniref:hypothetical protein n=1 Tax=Bradyrhizobium brasilense TaxID=1419277 RepID=UPI001E47FD82|nr:hypothetical protein [Bradyrhizobium brasilense]MCC8950220.1 site-specific integrase [Bradyrhizobium brasilense]